MELTTEIDKRKCDMGACKRPAKYAVRLNRSGIRSTLFMCDKCMLELYTLLGRAVVPKSYETLGKRNGSSRRE